jgi:hypothetical protein
MFMELRMGSDGQIGNPYGWPAQWGELRSAATSRGIPLDLVLTQFKVAHFNALFGSARRVRQLESDVLRLAADSVVSGIHLDVEIIEGQTQQPCGDTGLCRLLAGNSRPCSRCVC